jgi:hypothetical protein
LLKESCMLSGKKTFIALNDFKKSGCACQDEEFLDILQIHLNNVVALKVVITAIVITELKFTGILYYSIL